MKKRPVVLTIAGFDPSGGAGLLADVKTMEALNCYGLAVCTANTIQTDVAFESCYWIDKAIIKSQLTTLLNRFKVDVVKVGIIENWEVLKELLGIVLELRPSAKIVLDPVLKSSSGFQFQSGETAVLDQVLERVYLLTPNYQEIEVLYSDKSIEETINYLATKTNVLLKGGHKPDALGVDELFTIEGKRFVLNPKMKGVSEKHGSGCVLASAIASHLALGFPLLKACYKGKRYTEKFLSSNKSLLGFHSKK